MNGERTRILIISGFSKDLPLGIMFLRGTLNSHTILAFLSPHFALTEGAQR